MTPRWSMVAALAATQTVGYGVLQYPFAVLLVPIAAELDTSTTAVTGAYTVSVLVGAGIAVPVGRWLDRHGARGLMTAGSALGTALLVALSQVQTVAQLYVVQAGIGLVSAMVLYEAAFAVLVSWFAPDRRAAALLAVTVVAGFASSIFWPLTGLLVDRYGWREAVLILAVIHGALTVPLHAVAVRRAPRTPGWSSRAVGERRAALRDTRFWILAGGFVVHSVAVMAVGVHLVTALIELGHRATFAATVAGLLGVLSVTGRVVTTGAQRRWPLAGIVAAIFGLQAVAALALPLVGRSAAGAVVAVTAFGLGFGVATIARPALLADRYGTAAYASIAGVLAVPVTMAKAGAPLGAAALREATGGYPAVFGAVAACCAVAAAGIALSGRTGRPPPECAGPTRSRDPAADAGAGAFT